jgi:hypothetical protein
MLGATPLDKTTSKDAQELKLLIKFWLRRVAKIFLPPNKIGITLLNP